MKANIEIDNILYEVQYTIEPEEKEVRYYGDGSGYPGSPAKIILEYVFVRSFPKGLGIEPGDQLDDKKIESEIIDKLREIEIEG